MGHQLICKHLDLAEVKAKDETINETFNDEFDVDLIKGTLYSVEVNKLKQTEGEKIKNLDTETCQVQHDVQELNEVFEMRRHLMEQLSLQLEMNIHKKPPSVDRSTATFFFGKMLIG